MKIVKKILIAITVNIILTCGINVSYTNEISTTPLEKTTVVII